MHRLAPALLRPLLLALLALLLALLLLDTLPGVADALSGRHADAAERAALHARLGLAQSWTARVTDRLAALAQGDFGRSWSSGERVAEILAQRLPVSLVLLLPGFLLGHLLALWLATRRRGQTWVQGLAALGMAGGIVLLALLARALAPHLGLPVRDLPLAPWWKTLQHLVLPTLVLALAGFGYHYLRYRARYQQALAATFARAAQARGEAGGAPRAALRDLRGLVLLRLLFDFPVLLLSAAVLETLFAIPGLGARLVPAVLAGDQPVVAAAVVLGGLLFALLRALLALLLHRLDPRLLPSHA